MACIDGLTGFPEAIQAAYPKTEIQHCIIHQIRSSTKYVSYKDIKALMARLLPALLGCPCTLAYKFLPYAFLFNTIQEVYTRFEEVSSMIQAAKRKARGYHTFEGFSSMIYLIAGKLKLACANPLR